MHRGWRGAGHPVHTREWGPSHRPPQEANRPHGGPHARGARDTTTGRAGCLQTGRGAQRLCQSQGPNPKRPSGLETRLLQRVRVTGPTRQGHACRSLPPGPLGACAGLDVTEAPPAEGGVSSSLVPQLEPRPRASSRGQRGGHRPSMQSPKCRFRVSAGHPGTHTWVSHPEGKTVAVTRTVGPAG